MLTKLTCNKPFRIRFHEATVVDYFGMSRDELLKQNLYFIGFGFSYQAKDTKTNSFACDWKFKSGTLNTSGLFGSDPSLKTVAHRSDRQLELKLGAFLRISFNYMRATKTRKVQVRSIRQFMEYYKKDTASRLPTCPLPKIG